MKLKSKIRLSYHTIKSKMILIAMFCPTTYNRLIQTAR